MHSKLTSTVLLTVFIIAITAAPLKPYQLMSGQILGGSLNAPIRLEVFSDFQCSHCRDFYLNTIRPVLRDYCSKGKVCVIYHEFPLRIFQYSRPAARYSEAASRLGQRQLLAVYDVLFSDQAKWTLDGNIEASVAKVLTRPDMIKLKKILRDPSVDQAIDRELNLGNKKAVNSTPTLFMYSLGREERIQAKNEISYAFLKSILDRMIK